MRVLKICSALILIVLAMKMALALNAGNIDLVYYNNSKPVYEIQFLTVPLYYDTSHTPKLIVYGAGTNFSIQVTDYINSNVIVKLVNVYDGTERVIGYLTSSEPSKKFVISNLYPGYWTIVLVSRKAVWNIGKTHEIEIVGNPKLILELLNGKNVTLGDMVRVRVKVVGLYGETNVSMKVEGQKILHFSKVLKGNSVWDVAIPSKEIGVGKCRIVVSAMGITGSITFNITKPTVGLNLTNVTNVSVKVNKSKVNVSVNTKVAVNSTEVNKTKAVEVGVKREVNKTTKITKINKNETGVERTNNTANSTINKTSKKTPGFTAVTLVVIVLLLRKLKR